MLLHVNTSNQLISRKEQGSCYKKMVIKNVDIKGGALSIVGNGISDLGSNTWRETVCVCHWERYELICSPLLWLNSRTDEVRLPCLGNQSKR